MNGIDLLLNINIIIYFLLGYLNIQKYFFDFNPAISFISELEVLSNTTFENQDYEDAKCLIAEHQIFNYRPELKDIIIKTRSQKKLKLPDALIAATTRYLNIPLVTFDKAFLHIDGLNLILHAPATT